MPTSGNVFVVEFFCDMASGCMGSDIHFWYRLVVGPTTGKYFSATFISKLYLLVIEENSK